MLSLPAHAGITFQFEYTDAPGTGFFADTYGAARQAVLNKAASEFSSMFGSTFSNSGTIVLEAKMEYEPGVLASAGSNYMLDTDVLRDIVRTKLTTGEDLNGSGVDGSVAVNFGGSFSWETDFNTAPRPAGGWGWGDLGTYDFYGTLYHEFTHLLGFSPAMRADGSTLFNSVSYGTFAGLLVDGYGNSIISEAGALNQDIWNAASISYSMDGSDNGLFFAGRAAVAANGGEPVALYAPGEWDPGSSASHLDPDVTGQDGLMMVPYLATGRSVREYSDIEVAILTDLGYSVSVVPEPGTWSMMLAGLALLGSIARRRMQWALPA